MKYIKVLLFFNRPSLFLLFYLCIQSCSLSDTTKELSGGYFYTNEGANAKDITCHLPNRMGIYANVTKYDYNKDFIVAIQEPNYEQIKITVAFYLRDNLKKYPTNSREDANQSIIEADSILKNDFYYISIFSHKINYWIIANKTKEVLGPLTELQYRNKRNELKIPSSVNLK